MKKGFLASLLDLSFSEFITIRIVRFLYVLAMIAAAVFTLGCVISVFVSGETLLGFVALLFSPVIFFLMLTLFRVYMELLIVIFKVAENTTRLVELKQSAGGSQ